MQLKLWKSCLKVSYPYYYLFVNVSRNKIRILLGKRLIWHPLSIILLKGDAKLKENEGTKKKKKFCF